VRGCHPPQACTYACLFFAQVCINAQLSKKQMCINVHLSHPQVCIHAHLFSTQLCTNAQLSEKQLRTVRNCNLNRRAPNAHLFFPPMPPMHGCFNTTTHHAWERELYPCISAWVSFLLPCIGGPTPTKTPSTTIRTTLPRK
jgi:hypothetical protein